MPAAGFRVAAVGRAQLAVVARDAHALARPARADVARSARVAVLATGGVERVQAALERVARVVGARVLVIAILNGRRRAATPGEACACVLPAARAAALGAARRPVRLGNVAAAGLRRAAVARARVAVVAVQAAAALADAQRADVAGVAVIAIVASAGVERGGAAVGGVAAVGRAGIVVVAARRRAARARATGARVADRARVAIRAHRRGVGVAAAARGVTAVGGARVAVLAGDRAQRNARTLLTARGADALVSQGACAAGHRVEAALGGVAAVRGAAVAVVAAGHCARRADAGGARVAHGAGVAIRALGGVGSVDARPSVAAAVVGARILIVALREHARGGCVGRIRRSIECRVWSRVRGRIRCRVGACGVDIRRCRVGSAGICVGMGVAGQNIRRVRHGIRANHDVCHRVLLVQKLLRGWDLLRACAQQHADGQERTCDHLCLVFHQNRPAHATPVPTGTGNQAACIERSNHQSTPPATADAAPTPMAMAPAVLCWPIAAACAVASA